ncbi:hypothetical protein [Sinorhizobium meliloti]|uniref:Uncharacterized protein n=1 Tax=Rhizobium meliloti TaxID=382 RepID=A0AAW9TMY8_RHIML|nr:hypothetical protein [Sinorhizobium meliloti]MQW32390.1 hypothetical protein [Sinorhizobium meliloti]
MRLPGLSLSEKVPAAKDKPAKLAQKDRDARWTVKYSKVNATDENADISRDQAV